MVDNVLILAGGSGTRLWPASTKARPKQFLTMKNGKSLLQMTVERAFALDPAGYVVIITIQDQLEAVAEDCSGLDVPRDKLLLVPEPTARNTAPAITVAAAWIRSKRGEDQTMLVLPADHLISPVEVFRSDVEKAAVLAEDGMLVTFGISPSRPETGYGYIEAGEKLGPGLAVRSFKEKPDDATARSFVEQGNFYWNSGMFAFRGDCYWDELRAHAPDVHRPFDALEPPVDERRLKGLPVILEGDQVASVYERSPTISIDYAVMEQSEKVAMVAAEFVWNDVGSWDEIAKLAESGEMDAGGSYTGVEASDNFVYSDLPVAVCGLDDIIVVVKNGMVLVCRRGSSQGVKSIVEAIKDQGDSELL